MAADNFQSFMHRVAQATGLKSQTDLAQALNITRSTISQAKNRGRIPEQWIASISEQFDVDPDWLREGESCLDRFVEVPVVAAKLGAGGGSHVVDSEVQGHMAFRSGWLQKKGQSRDMVLMQVIGDSMEPSIREGDYVLIDQSKQEIYSGGTYALGLEDTIMVKQLDKRPNELVILSTNPRYSSIVLSGDELDTVRLIGRVVGIWRDLY